MTLEQLIEACGDRFIQLKFFPENTIYRYVVSAFIKDNEYEWFDGSTPTEAVQKLYDYLKENTLLTPPSPQGID